MRQPPLQWLLGAWVPWVLPAWVTHLAGVGQAHRILASKFQIRVWADQAPPVVVWMHTEEFLGCGLGEGGEYLPLRLHQSATAPGASRAWPGSSLLNPRTTKG